MSSYIKVNHMELGNFAAKIEESKNTFSSTVYKIAFQSSGAVGASCLVSGAYISSGAAGGSWVGVDASMFNNQLASLDGSDSSSAYLEKGLQSYADFLRVCANQYKETQTNAINRANSLPLY
jgi:hypothetical protein